MEQFEENMENFEIQHFVNNINGNPNFEQNTQVSKNSHCSTIFTDESFLSTINDSHIDLCTVNGCDEYSEKVDYIFIAR